MDKIELGFREWLAKIIEKGTFILMKIQDHIEISEDDYYYLETMHGLYDSGNLPLYKTIIDGFDEKADDQELFLPESHDVTVGMDVAIFSTEPTKNEQNDTKKI